MEILFRQISESNSALWKFNIEVNTFPIDRSLGVDGTVIWSHITRSIAEHVHIIRWWLVGVPIKPYHPRWIRKSF